MPHYFASDVPVELDITPAWWRGSQQTFVRVAKCATRLAEIGASNLMSAPPDVQVSDLARLLVGASVSLTSSVRKPHLRLSVLLLKGHTVETLEPGRLWLVQQLEALDPDRMRRVTELAEERRAEMSQRRAEPLLPTAG